MRHSQTFTPIRSQAWEKSSFPELPTAEAKWSPRDGLHTPANSIRAAKKSSTSHHCHHGRSVGHEMQCLNTPGLSIGAPNLSLFRRSSERMKKSGPEKGFGPNTTSIQGREACISHQRAPRIITQQINVQKAPYDTSLALQDHHDGQQGCPAAPPRGLNTVQSHALRAQDVDFSYLLYKATKDIPSS